MKRPTVIYLAAALCFIGLLGAYVAGTHTPVALGSSDIVILPTYPTATSVWVGKDIDTTIVATSTGRVRLEIENISGATSTAQALYCNYGDRPATIYSGFVIEASSSKAFTLDQLYRGALHCKFPVSSSTIAITDF